MLQIIVTFKRIANHYLGKLQYKADLKDQYLLNLPSETNALALQPSEPIQKNCPVAFSLLTAFISSATSWSDPNTITPDIK